MKKTIKKGKVTFLFLIALITLIFGIQDVNAAATDKKHCGEITNLEYCPVNGKDSYGDACMLGYNGSVYGCMKNESAKKCADYQKEGVCPSKDEYGNTCRYYGDPSTCYIYEESQNTEFKRCEQYDDYKTCPVGRTDYLGHICQSDSGGKCYTSINNQSCYEIINAKICNGRTNECVWAKNTDNSVYSCHKVGDTDYIVEACPQITDYTACDGRSDCKWATVDPLIGHQCIEVILPTSESVSCENITDKATCIARVDCTPDGRKCTESATYNNGTSGNSGGIIQEADDFVCSDVKFLTSAWLFIRILSPFLVVLFGSLDFFKAMIANDEKKMKEARGKFPKRLIAFILLILLPFTIQFIFEFMGTYGSQNMCLVKCIATNDTSEKGCD